MNFSRRINKNTLLLLSLLFSVSLLCAQEVSLHVHNLDHGENVHLNNTHAIDNVKEHDHSNNVHLSHDSSHKDHHNGVISNIETSPEGLVKNANNTMPVFALVFFFFITLIFVLPRQFVQCRRESKLIIERYYVLSPPLRAPPQY